MSFRQQFLRGAEYVASHAALPHHRPSPAKLRKAVAGKVVLVTGASYGIGQATAVKLGAAGATVLLVARSEDKLAETVATITAAGGTAHAYAADLSDGGAVDKLAQRVLERHGRVDVVVSNAGKSIRRSIHDSYDRFHDFQRTIDVNYLGPVRLLLALLPAMAEAGGGHIVNVSTAGVRTPPAPRWAAYQASKSAFDVWLRSVAPEIRSAGITTSTVYMPLVRTRMSAPTKALRNMPGLHRGEAADLVLYAITERPRSVEPWWFGTAQIAAVAAEGPVDAVIRRLGRRGL